MKFVKPWHRKQTQIAGRIGIAKTMATRYFSSIAMSFIEPVLERTRRIEKLLGDLGGTGRGLHERAGSIESKLSPPLFRQLRFIATIRNKLVHEAEPVIDLNQPQFLGKCDGAIAQLSALVSEAPRLSARIFSSPPPALVGEAPRLPARIFSSPPPIAARRTPLPSPLCDGLAQRIINECEWIVAPGCAVGCALALPSVLTYTIETEFGSLRYRRSESTDWLGVWFLTTLCTLAAFLVVRSFTKNWWS